MAKFGGAVGAAAPAIYDPTNSQPHGGVSSGIGYGHAASDGDNYANQRIGGTAVNLKVEKADGDGVAVTLLPAAGALTAQVVGTPMTPIDLGSATGFTPLNFHITAGALPPGLALAEDTGIISGTPTSATGSPFGFSVTCQDNEGNVDVNAYTMVVTTP